MPDRRPLSCEQFAALCRGERLRDRSGRIWEVVAEPYEDAGEMYVNLRSGDVVKRERAPWSGDDYELIGS